MLTDKKYYFQDDVGTAGDNISVTTTAEISTQIMDLKKNGILVDTAGMGPFDSDKGFAVYVRLKTLGAETIETIQVKDSADGSTFAAALTKVVASADFVADTIVARIPLPPGIKRFLRLSFTNTTSGTNVVNAWIASA